MARLRRSINRKLEHYVYSNGDSYYYSHPSMLKRDDFGNLILNKKGKPIREKEYFGSAWKEANQVAVVLNAKFSCLADRIDQIYSNKHVSENPTKGFTVCFVVSAFQGKEKDYAKCKRYKNWSDAIVHRNDSNLNKFKNGEFGSLAYSEMGIPEYRKFIVETTKGDGQKKLRTLLKQVDEYAKSNGFLGKRPPSGHVVENVQVESFEKRERPRIPNMATYESIKAKMPTWYQYAMDFALLTCQGENEIITAKIMESLKKHPTKNGWYTFNTTRKKTNQDILIEFERGSDLGVLIGKMTAEASRLGCPYLVNARYDKPNSRLQLKKSKKTHRNQVTADYFQKVMPKYLKGTDLEMKPKGYVFHEIRSLSVRMHLAIGREKMDPIDVTKDMLKRKTGHKVDRMIDLYAQGDQKEVLVGCADIRIEQMRKVRVQE